MTPRVGFATTRNLEGVIENPRNPAPRPIGDRRRGVALVVLLAALGFAQSRDRTAAQSPTSTPAQATATKFDQAGSEVAAGESESAAQNEPSEDKTLAQGCDLLLHANYDLAEQVFDAGAERYPTSSRLQLGRGMALYYRGLYDQAVDASIKASDLAPQDPRPYQLLGKLSDLVPEKAAALTGRLQRFAQSNPNNAQAQYDYAMGLWNAHRGSSGGVPASQVQPLLERAIKLDPEFADAHLQLGALFSEQHHYQKAAVEYRQAVALEPDLAAGHYGLSQALVRLGDTSQANQELQTYQRLQTLPAAEDRKREEMRSLVLTIQAPVSGAPSGGTKASATDVNIDYSDSADLKPGGISGSVDAGGYSSQTQARGAELRQALGTLAPPATSKTDGPEAGPELTAFQRASALLLSGNYAQAAHAFEQGTAQFPKSARMTLGLGVADYSQGLYAEAIDALCEAVDLSPGQPQAYFFLAQAYSTSPEKKADEVMKRMANYASSHSGNALAQYYYALCLWRSRIAGSSPADPRQVEQLLHSAIALDPSLAEAHFELGVVLEDQGQTAQAASEFERAIAIDPQWAEAHYRLGQAYRQAGEGNKARKELDEAEHLRKSGDTEDQRLRAEIRRLLGS